MELYLLRSFLAVARAEHLGKAARAVHLSQPTLSAHLKALEKELGLSLFTRTPKGMSLTQHGARLLARAKSVLSSADELMSTAQELRQTVSGQIHLGIIADPAALRLPQLMLELGASHPALRISLRQGVSGAILRDIRAGVLDAGFFEGEVEGSGITVLPLAKARLVACFPKSWESRVAEADWEAIAAMPWIGTSQDCSFSAMTRLLFQRHGLEVSPSVCVDQEDALPSLVASGVGLSLLREAQALVGVQARQIGILPGGTLDIATSFVTPLRSAKQSILDVVTATVAGVWSDRSRM